MNNNNDNDNGTRKKQRRRILDESRDPFSENKSLTIEELLQRDMEKGAEERFMLETKSRDFAKTAKLILLILQELDKWEKLEQLKAWQMKNR